MPREKVLAMSLSKLEEQRLLLVVEDLLCRFYQSNTSGEEKKKLEAELHDLRKTKFTWQYCLENLDKFNNQYLWFFGSSTVESVLSRWSTLSAEDTQYLRSGLIKQLSNYNVATPALHREKVAQVLSLVATYQFPTDYPEYMDHILLLLKQRFPIGLALARALGDSVTQEKYVLSLQHRERFKAAVTPYIPEMLRALEPYFAHYLARVGEQPHASDAAASMEHYTNELLQMLQQYFCWIELQCVEPSLVEALLQVSHLRSDTDQTDVSLSALSALTELYYRQQRLLPATGKQMVLGVIKLLQQPGLPAAEELYQEKMSDLVRLCAARELLAKHEVDWQPFFEGLYQFTVFVRFLSAFLERIGTWNMIYQMSTDEPVGCADPAVHRLLSEVYPIKLAMHTMERMLPSNDLRGEFLMNGDLVAPDEEISEVQRLSNLSLELVEKLAKVAPEQMYEMVLSQLATSDGSPYRRGVQMLRTIATRPELVVPNSGPCFSDFIPVCQMVTRLCIVLHNMVPASVNAVRWLSQEQLELFNLLADCVPLDRVSHWQGEKMLVATAQILDMFRSLLPLDELRRVSGTLYVVPPSVTEQQLVRLINQLTKFLQPPEQLESSGWRTVAKASASLLLYVVSRGLLNARCVFEQLDGNFLASNIFFHDNLTRQMVRQTVIDTLLVKWNADSASADAASVADGQLALRREHLTRYVRTMAQTVLSVDPAVWRMAFDANMQHRTQLQYALELHDLTELLRHYRLQGASAKALLASAVRDVIDRALYIYTETNGRGLHLPGTVPTSTFLSRPKDRESDDEVDDPLASFLHAVIETLQVQLGEPFLQQVIRVFLGQVRADTHAMQLHHSLTTLLGIFVLIVQQPGNRTLIADIVQLCVDDVLPVALSKDDPQSPDAHGRLCITLFQLFHAILLHRWRYFVRPQVPDQPHSLANEGQYAAIMQGYGLVIMNSADPQLVQDVLGSLQQLNERCKLFREPYFAERFAAGFMHAMLHVLVEAKGDLHHGLLVELLFELATIDRRKFYDLTVTVCPTLQPELRDELCQCTDMPTFARLANQFVSMARMAVFNLAMSSTAAAATSISSGVQS